MRSKRSSHSLVLFDDCNTVRITESAFEDKPRKQVWCGLGNRVTGGLSEFSRSHIIGDNCLSDFHGKGDG